MTNATAGSAVSSMPSGPPTASARLGGSARERVGVSSAMPPIMTDGVPRSAVARDDGHGPQRPAAPAGDLHRQRDDLEAVGGQLVELRHVLEDRHAGGAEDAMG